MDWWISKRTRILFPCIATDFYDTVDPRYLTKLTSISVLGPGNTAPQEYGYAIGFGPEEPVGTIFTTPGERVKIVMREREIGVRYLLLNSKSAESVELARGDGFQILRHGGAFIRSSFQAAKDMWTLNEARMRELAKYSIENQRMTNLHEQAKEHLDLAEEAIARQEMGFVCQTHARGYGPRIACLPRREIDAKRCDSRRDFLYAAGYSMCVFYRAVAFYLFRYPRANRRFWRGFCADLDRSRASASRF